MTDWKRMDRLDMKILVEVLAWHRTTNGLREITDTNPAVERLCELIEEWEEANKQT